MRKIPLLGDLESAVLEHLWAHGAGEGKDVHRVVGQPRGIALNTVNSALERLHRKRLLIREKVGHAFRYAPALSRAEFRARAMAAAAGDLRGAEAAGVLSAFLDLALAADTRDLERIRTHIEDAGARRKGR